MLAGVDYAEVGLGHVRPEGEELAKVGDGCVLGHGDGESCDGC